MIGFLNKIEEFCDLSLEEWNFRKIVQDNLANLLEQQRVYWRQRGTNMWATLGDENTKKIHANATIKHSKSCIRYLKDSNGVEKFQHDDKANLLWEAFKDRLGQSEFNAMHFDLTSLLPPINDLDIWLFHSLMMRLMLLLKILNQISL
jgi:hypothetical protein